MVIVSITSYRQRLPFIRTTLNSIYNQTVKADKIVLTLYKDDVSFIPSLVQKDISEGKLELIVCDEDIKSHTKYYFVMRKYPNDIIITIDDDLIYPNDMISSLLESYKKHPNCISARRVHKIIKGEKYCNWEHECKDILEPSMVLFATGCGGVLYPPNILEIDLLDKNDIVGCIYADDILLKHIQYKKGIKVVWAKNNQPHPLKNRICMAISKPLSDYNVINNGNDRYIEKYKIYDHEE